MITVKASDPKRAFWERHPKHPGGEVWVSGDSGVTVAETGRVREAIQNGRLVEVGKKKSEKELATPSLTDINGIGPAKAKELNEKGIHTLGDLVHSDDPAVSDDWKEQALLLLDSEDSE